MNHRTRCRRYKFPLELSSNRCSDNFDTSRTLGTRIGQVSVCNRRFSEILDCDEPTIFNNEPGNPESPGCSMERMTKPTINAEPKLLTALYRKSSELIREKSLSSGKKMSFIDTRPRLDSFSSVDSGPAARKPSFNDPSSIKPSLIELDYEGLLENDEDESLSQKKPSSQITSFSANDSGLQSIPQYSPKVLDNITYLSGTGLSSFNIGYNDLNNIDTIKCRH